jgi:hypothetical protein
MGCDYMCVTKRASINDEKSIYYEEAQRSQFALIAWRGALL